MSLNGERPSLREAQFEDFPDIVQPTKIKPESPQDNSFGRDPEISSDALSILACGLQFPRQRT